MGEFIQRSERSFELPLDCKDLFDLQEVRNWQPCDRPQWLTPITDKLAYIEGYLTRLLESAGKSYVVCISRFQDAGQVTIIPDLDVEGRVLFALWHNVTQKEALLTLFE